MKIFYLVVVSRTEHLESRTRSQLPRPLLLQAEAVDAVSVVEAVEAASTEVVAVVGQSGDSQPEKAGAELPGPEAGPARPPGWRRSSWS